MEIELDDIETASITEEHNTDNIDLPVASNLPSGKTTSLLLLIRQLLTNRSRSRPFKTLKYHVNSYSQCIYWYYTKIAPSIFKPFKNNSPFLAHLELERLYEFVFKKNLVVTSHNHQSLVIMYSKG